LLEGSRRRCAGKNRSITASHCWISLRRWAGGSGILDLGGPLVGLGGKLYASASYACAIGPSDESAVSFEQRFPDENGRRRAGWASAGTRKEATE
jgi:hypothetical protein